MTAHVLLHAESTDDPSVVSWVTSLVATACLRSEDPPLLADLIADGAVTEVWVSPGHISVAAAVGHTWRTLGGAVRQELDDQLQRSVDRRWDEDDTVRAVAVAVLARQVGELARSHGGLLSIDEVRDGVVTVGLSGACGHCPAALSTVNARFEKALRRELPWLKGVKRRSHSSLFA